MFEISTNTQIGFGLTTLGLFFVFLGVVLLFDKGLLAIGNLMFLAGLIFIKGFKNSFTFFFQVPKLKGSLIFFLGIIVLLAGHPIIGFVIELIGSYMLFRGTAATAFQYATTFIPFLGSVKNKSVV